MHTLLRKLGIDRRNLRALPLLPLAEVAWADGDVQAPELDLILRKAAERDLRDEDRILLDGWLAYPPSPEYLRAGRMALAWYRQRGDPGLDPSELKSVLVDARDVAAAAGGFFGFGAVSRAEREVLNRLAKEIETPINQGFAPPEGHPDFVKKSNAVTLAYHATPQGADEGDAVLQTEFDVPMRLPLRASETWIGAGEDADVRLVDDPNVVESHCVIDRTPSGYVARALDGGLWVNGERVRERRLLGGETIRISAAVSFVFKLVRPWDDASAT